jgi:hypothetical protein
LGNNNDSSEKKKPSEQVENTNFYSDFKQSVLSEEWQKIFEELKLDEEEYKIFLSVSPKVDDPSPYDKK